VSVDAEDYYTLLGVERDADAGAIKKAYRKLALKYHPDRNPGDPQAEIQFKRVTAAYAVLSDDVKRADYDRQGRQAFSGHTDDPFATGDVRVDPEDLHDLFGDLFDELFGGFFRGKSVHHGKDLTEEMTISLEEAASGTDKQVVTRRLADCTACTGSGAEPGTQTSRCATCGGSGQVRVGGGLVGAVQPCPYCKGRGYLIAHPCKRCRGTGQTEREVTLTFHVPAGVESGTRIRLEGEGEPGRAGGMNGDLYVRLTVEDHPFFEREGVDVLCEVPVSFPQAALGAVIEVPTLEGKVKVRIPAGTQSGRTLRLKGKGLYDRKGEGRGDQRVKIQIETPQNLTDRQRSLLEEFESLSDNPSASVADSGGAQPARGSFLQKLRDFFE
jgi:molecular chaperone DnaJ